MSDPRDDLADIIFRATGRVFGRIAAANAIIAAGWKPPGEPVTSVHSYEPTAPTMPDVPKLSDEIRWGIPVDRSEIKPPYPMWCPACETVHLEGQHVAVPDA